MTEQQNSEEIRSSKPAPYIITKDFRKVGMDKILMGYPETAVRIMTSLGTKPDIEKVRTALRIYPDILEFYTLLGELLGFEGEFAEAEAILEKAIQRFPDSIEPRLVLGEIYLELEDKEKIQALFPNDFDLSSSFTGKTTIFLDHFLSFQKIAIRYAVLEDDIDKAFIRNRVLTSVDPKSDMSREIQDIMDMRISKQMREIFPERRLQSHYINFKPSFTMPEATESPTFTHAEVAELYNIGIESLTDDEIDTLLALPRETVIQDLEKILIDSMARYSYFNSPEAEEDDKGWDAPLHAIILLSELKSEGTMPILMNMIRQGDDFFDFWFGDFGSFEQVLSVCANCGKNYIQEMKEFMKEPVYQENTGAGITNGMVLIAIQYPEKRQEVVEALREILQYYIDHKDDDTVTDSLVAAQIIVNLQTLQDKESLPLIKEAFLANIPDRDFCGDFDMIAEEMDSVPTNLLNQYYIGREIYEEWRNIDDPEEDDVEITDVEIADAEIADAEITDVEITDAEITDVESADNSKEGVSEEEILAPWEEARERIFQELRSEFELDESIVKYNNSVVSEGETYFREEPKVGRNDPCPCGSGKKYKKCCGK